MTFKHIRSKLLLLFSLAVTASVLLVLALMVWLQTHLIRAEWQASLQAQASLIAHNSQAAIDFQDPREASRLLHSLENNPAILQASFYTDSNRILFARYQSPRLAADFEFTDAPQRSGETFRFSDNRLLVWAPVPGDSNEAYLEIIGSLAPMQHAIRQMALKTALYLSALLIILLLLANQAARRMASPLQEMSRLTSAMADNPQLADRIHVTGEDELAQLGSSLNHMIDSLQTRDRELELYRQGLEEQVEQRTRELVVAVDTANEASRAKSDFLARMSHEIRTPMNAIVGLGQLLLNSGLNEHQRQQQEQVLSASDMLLGLINDILDYSRIEAGKLEVEHIPFALEQIFRDVSSQLALRAQQRGLELLLHQAADVPERIYGDPLRLRQVLINLISNAIKFTETGEVVVRVERISAPDSKHDRLRFSVRDTGMGIPSEKLETLFTPFTQVDGSMTRRFGGSGLGLAICDQLVGLMGGTISVDSQFGIGSTFTFDIPCDIASERRAHQQASGYTLKQQRALIIDDNASARDILQAMLEELGMRTETADSGEQGLHMLQQASAAGDPFQLILLDWLMPGMDGIETARHINSSLHNQAPAILMVTAGSYEKLSGLVDNVGLKHILTKPVNRSALQESILESMGLSRASLPPATQEASTVHDFSPIRHARILLVDDVELNRLVALALLEETGIQVDTAEHGLQAIAMVEENDYDLVLMDIQMPEMDGLTATREIRKRPHLHNLPILAMTAHARASDRELSLEAGMNDHLTKPVNQDILYRALLQWIPHRTADDARPTTPAGPADAVAAASVLPPLPGVDTAKGLTHTMNKPELYRRILERFPGEFAASAEAITQSIAMQDWPLARRLAHSLKSGAATIGADALATMALAAEQQLAQQHAPDDTQLDALAAELDRLCQLFTMLQPEHPAPGTETAQVTGRLPELIDQLHSLLDSDDARALTVLDSLQEHLAGMATVSTTLIELRDHIEDIEYEAALNLLPRLRQLVQELSA